MQIYHFSPELLAMVDYAIAGVGAQQCQSHEEKMCVDTRIDFHYEHYEAFKEALIDHYVKMAAADANQDEDNVFCEPQKMPEAAQGGAAEGGAAGLVRDGEDAPVDQQGAHMKSALQKRKELDDTEKNPGAKGATKKKRSEETQQDRWVRQEANAREDAAAMGRGEGKHCSHFGVDGCHFPELAALFCGNCSTTYHELCLQKVYGQLQTFCPCLQDRDGSS